MSLSIITEVIDSIKIKISDLKKITLKQVVIGMGYTAVELNTGHIGLCYSFQRENPFHHSRFDNIVGSISGTYANYMLEMAKSWNLGESILGVATINALSQLIFDRFREYKMLKGNVMEYLDIRNEDKVVFVGNIIPLIERIEKKAKEIIVLERDLQKKSEYCLPDTLAEEVIPDSDITIITGTSLVNGTLERLIALSKNSREKVLVGATSSFIPDPVFKKGITLIGGLKILYPSHLIRIVSEGGGTKQLKRASDFYCIKNHLLAH